MLNYEEIVAQTTQVVETRFNTEYTRVCTNLEKEVKERAKQGYYSTSVAVKLALWKDILAQLKIDYPKFKFELAEMRDRCTASSIICSWHPDGLYENERSEN
jgi:hypothetical protein